MKGKEQKRRGAMNAHGSDHVAAPAAALIGVGAAVGPLLLVQKVVVGTAGAQSVKSS